MAKTFFFYLTLENSFSLMLSLVFKFILKQKKVIKHLDLVVTKLILPNLGNFLKMLSGILCKKCQSIFCYELGEGSPIAGLVWGLQLKSG